MRPNQRSSMDPCQGLRETPVVVVMVPLPAQGHLNQLLHFSRLVSDRGITVHYIGSAMHNRQAKHRVQGWDPCTISNIHFHDFPLPPFLNPPPNPQASNKFPDHLQPTLNASIHLREPLASFLFSLSSTARRVVVVHDPLMSFAAQEASSLPNAEAYVFNCISTFASLFSKWEALGKPTDGRIVLPIDLLHLSSEAFVTNRVTNRFSEFAASRSEFYKFSVGNLYNSCQPMEGKFIDILAEESLLGKKKQWAVGPLNPVVFNLDGRRHKCLDWLDKQPASSVLYVSFGTMTSLSDQQITELAIGLESSEQRFVWVMRDADIGDIYAEDKKVRKIKLPDGYEERVEGVGLIIRDWAPQLEILAHPSTGGFLSHCGWNSCMESMSMGVPIAAWPMHSDQPLNTVLVSEVLKIGVVVRKWECWEELVSSDVIESVVRKLMVSEEGKEMRKRAEELGVAVRRAVSKGRSSHTELDSFVQHITR